MGGSRGRVGRRWSCQRADVYPLALPALALPTARRGCVATRALMVSSHVTCICGKATLHTGKFAQLGGVGRVCRKSPAQLDVTRNALQQLEGRQQVTPQDFRHTRPLQPVPTRLFATFERHRSYSCVGVRPGISDAMRRIVSMLPTPPLASTFCASFAISSARHACPAIEDDGRSSDAIGSFTSRAH